MRKMKTGAGQQERQQGLDDSSTCRTCRQADGDCSAAAGSRMHHHSNKIHSLLLFECDAPVISCDIH